MKKVLYVDMDGVLADFEGGVKALDSGIEWDENNFNDENVNNVCAANPTVFEGLPEIEGGIDAVNMLKDHYDIYFLSTPMHHVPESYKSKRIWLKEKFGDWVDKRLILTHRKDLNKGEYLIDDRITNGVESFDGHHIHFGTSEFPNWDSVLNYLI